MKQKKIVWGILVSLLLVAGVFAAPYLVDEDLDMLGNDILNAFNIYGTHIYQNGKAVLDTDDLNDILNYSRYSNISFYWNDLNTPADISISDLDSSGQEDLNVNQSDYWNNYDIASDLNNLITLHWDNITNKFIESVAGNYLFMNGAELNFNENLLNDTFIFRNEESELNVNSSGFWDNLDSESDLTPSNFLTAGDYLLYNGNIINVNASAILGSANDLDSSGNVADDSHYHGNSTITNLDWDKLQNYPVACPENTFLTQLGDSITCTGISDIYLLNTGDTATGDYIITGEINATSFYQDGNAVIDDGTGLSALTSGEIDQLENIGTTTISATQWGYLGGQDQAVATTSAPTFATVNTGQGANELYAMNQNVRTTDSPTFDGLILTDTITGLNYTINANSLQEGLIGYWGFEYGSGGTAYDSSREGNDGTLMNMDNSTCWVAGKDGTALQFDGVDDAVELASPIELKPGMTISVWVHPRTVYSGIISISAVGSSVNSFYFDGGRMNFRLNNSNNQFYFNENQKPFNNTNHIAISWYDNGLADVYWNGDIWYSDFNIGNDTGMVRYLGTGYSGPPGFTLDGFLDDFRIYDRALSGEEIRALYYGLGSQPTGHLALK
ncbi:MAG: hypothetical protein PWQ59_448 [Thermoanaerobacterium sp.]|nr:hypothetical protein [Thermoanaerobacterium sp.]